MNFLWAFGLFFLRNEHINKCQISKNDNNCQRHKHGSSQKEKRLKYDELMMIYP